MSGIRDNKLCDMEYIENNYLSGVRDRKITILAMCCQESWNVQKISKSGNG